ncbi:type VI secretion system Vgr family protein [Collimonas silvisoli]|uniref:type VI secretion system Vgr family protein n=1 Tax=Collimonas silvisoli TaxID=2825884 RepID=UPI002E76C72C|nr:type VI secretion system tip protein TssI/VgrG [Collimonas silvisoli]
MFTSPRTLSVKSVAIPEIMGQPALVPVSIKGSESLNSLYAYTVILKTPDALVNFASAVDDDLDSFLGKELTVAIQLEGSGSFVAGMPGGSGLANIGAGVREISGLVSTATILRQVGRYVFYEITLEPWLKWADGNADCRIFQDKSVVEILDEVLSKYTFPVDKRLFDTYPKRDYVTQFSESDFTFFSRLCEVAGINYFFEHKDGKHRLVLTDGNAAHQPFHSDAYHVLNYYGEKPRIDQEFIHTFSPAHRVTPGRYTSRDYDYTRPRSTLEVSHNDHRVSDHNAEVYEYHTDAHYVQPKAGPQQATNEPLEEGKKNARIRMERLRNNAERASGAGHVRALVPGCTFTLGRHPVGKANIEYLIVATRFEMEDVAQETQRPDGDPQQFRVNVDFEVVPLRGEQYRPESITPRPAMHILTAIVVGPENKPIWTDNLGRIKVQFQWDRLGQADQNSSCWVRVSSPWAGNQLGASHIPRIKQEVLIDFISGNPDLPICTGRVHNQMNLPAWSLPGQSALSGFRSRELTPNGGNSAAGRSNHLVMDDTEEKIQVQLKSDHQHSQLSLGNITRIEDNAGRKDPRGQGYELRTDGHGAIRAKEGLLITTEGRSSAQAHITDMGETVQRLTQARDQHENLADLAQLHQAQENNGDQSDVAKIIKTQNDAIKGSGGDAKAGSFPELAEPHLILASPAGIETTTPQSTHIASGEHIALTSGGHVSLSIGQRLLASVKNGIRLFTHRGGVKATAAQGDIEIQALKDSINLLAKLNITHTANRITITAQEEVMINGGGSYTKWAAGGIDTGTSGAWKVHSASRNWIGPANLSTPKLPVPVKAQEQMVFNLHTLAGLQHSTPEPYQLYRDGALIERGVTDEWGRVVVKNHIPTSQYEVKLSEGSRITLPVNQKIQGQQQHLSNQGFRDLGDAENGVTS